MEIQSIKYSVSPQVAMVMNEMCAMIEKDITEQHGPLPSDLMIRLVGSIIQSYGESVSSMGGEEVKNEPIN